MNEPYTSTAIDELEAHCRSCKRQKKGFCPKDSCTPMCRSSLKPRTVMFFDGARTQRKRYGSVRIHGTRKDPERGRSGRPMRSSYFKIQSRRAPPPPAEAERAYSPHKVQTQKQASLASLYANRSSTDEDALTASNCPNKRKKSKSAANNVHAWTILKPKCVRLKYRWFTGVNIVLRVNRRDSTREISGPARVPPTWRLHLNSTVNGDGRGFGSGRAKRSNANLSFSTELCRVRSIVSRVSAKKNKSFNFIGNRLGSPVLIRSERIATLCKLRVPRRWILSLR